MPPLFRPQVEVCVDNLESLRTANRAGVERIELCAALALGGLTPSYGMIEQACRLSRVPLSLIIRPRAGDFLFSGDEIEQMCADIEIARKFGIRSVVIGALTPQAMPDLPALARLTAAAHGMEITFHRAFDLCADPLQALEQIIALGCTRLLTSGMAQHAEAGIPMLQKLVQQADGRIRIMAGCGIHAQNVAHIVRQTHVPEVHLSAKGVRQSQMRTHSNAVMGNHAQHDGQWAVTDSAELEAVISALAQLHTPQSAL